VPLVMAVDAVLAEPVLMFALRIALGLEADNPNVHPDGVPIIAAQVVDLIDDEDAVVARVARLALLALLDGDEPGLTRAWELLETGGGA
jgi:hypothetical protein